MRLIDADELQHHFENCYKDHVPCQSEWEVGVADTYTALADFVSDLPAIDAEPVVHAHWDMLEDPVDPDEPVDFCCTKCHVSTTIPTHYCPNCGAKMNEVITDEKE